jgi:hypothetical protein
MADEKRPTERCGYCRSDVTALNADQFFNRHGLGQCLGKPEITRTTNPDARAIAEKIADVLFTNGAGEKPVELQMKMRADKYGGGWGEKPMASKIAEILESELPRWIPVGERLPEAPEDFECREYDVTTYHDKEGYLTRTDIWTERGFDRWGNITIAWRERPAPYQPEATNET